MTRVLEIRAFARSSGRGRRLLGLLSPLALTVLLPCSAAAASEPAAHGARTYGCGQLRGAGARNDPWIVSATNGRLTTVRCRGFPLGQGAPDFYAFKVPPLSRLDGDDDVMVGCRPTRSEPAEVSLVLDDLGPFALNIRGQRYVDGSWALRDIVLRDVPELTAGWWLLRVERLRALSSAPRYTLWIDLRG